MDYNELLLAATVRKRAAEFRQQEFRAHLDNHPEEEGNPNKFNDWFKGKTDIPYIKKAYDELKTVLSVMKSHDQGEIP